MIKTSNIISNLLIFEISNFSFCIDLDDVYLIERIDNYEQPKMPGFSSQNNIRSRNTDIILIDLAKYFDLPPMNLLPSSRRIIVNHLIVEGKLALRYGFIADKVSEIVAPIDGENFQILNPTESMNNGFLCKTILYGNRELLLPDFKKISSSLLKGKFAKIF